jgi:hypothetical protein
MEKQTKIYLGLAAAGVLAYLILKPKMAKGQTLTKEETPKTTKDCIRTIHYCGTKPSKTEIIQIPLDAKCDSYSVYPPCQQERLPDILIGSKIPFDWVSGWNKTPIKNNNINTEDLVVFA